MTITFQAERDVLGKAIADAGRAAVTRKTETSILSAVRMDLAGDSLTVTGTDLNLSISAVVDVDGSSDGTAIIKAAQAAKAVKSLAPGPVAVTMDGADVCFEETGAEGLGVKLATRNPEKWPIIPVPDGPAATVDDVAGFRIAVEQVTRAVSDTDTRPILTGVLVEPEGKGVRLAATNSYRLTIKDLSGMSILGDQPSALVPGRALKELARLLNDDGPLQVSFDRRHVAFAADGTTVTSRLIDGDFPNYRKLVPDSGPNVLTADRADLLRTLKRVKRVVPRGSVVRIGLTAGGARFTVADEEIGEVSVSVDAGYDGDEMIVGLNLDYLFDGIDTAPGETVRVEFDDEQHPVLVKAPADKAFLSLVMPVRLGG